LNLWDACWVEFLFGIRRGKEKHPDLQKRAQFTLNFGKVWGYYEWSRFQRDAH